METMTIAGYVGRDAEIKIFNGQEYTTFSVAVDKSYKKSDNTKVEQTNWYSVLRKGSGIAPHLKKGTYLIIQGEPRHKIYKDHSGQYNISLNMNADKINFGPSKPVDNTPPQEGNYRSPQVKEAMPTSSAVVDLTGDQDDLPF